jgi:hypothetical protein
MQLAQQEITWGDQKAVYTGPVDEGMRPHGVGRLETKQGVYTGEFVEGRMEGQVRRRRTEESARLTCFLSVCRASTITPTAIATRGSSRTRSDTARDCWCGPAARSTTGTLCR